MAVTRLARIVLAPLEWGLAAVALGCLVAADLLGNRRRPS